MENVPEVTFILEVTLCVLLGLEVPKALPRLGSNSFIETFFSSKIGLIKNVRLSKK